MDNPNGSTQYYEPKPSFRQEIEAAINAAAAASTATKPSTPGYVYLLQAGEYFKIGRTVDLAPRIKQLQIQLPFPLRLTIAFQTSVPLGWEQTLHQLFRHRRANGEWFRLTDSDISKVFKLACVIAQSAKPDDE